MADTKISGLTGLAATDVAVATDVLPIVDTSVTTTKKITVAALGQAMIVLGTEQASTSGTEIDFTGIPAGTKRISIMFVGVSMNGTSGWQVQLGDAGGIETSGYLGAASNLGTPSLWTSGFGIEVYAAAAVIHGSYTLELQDSAQFTWIGRGVLARSDTATLGVITGAGSKSLSAELTQVRITSSNGTDAFDAGAINISYE